MEQQLNGLPELVKRALDHAAELQRQADFLDESVYQRPFLYIVTRTTVSSILSCLVTLILQVFTHLSADLLLLTIFMISFLVCFLSCISPSPLVTFPVSGSSLQLPMSQLHVVLFLYALCILSWVGFVYNKINK